MSVLSVEEITVRYGGLVAVLDVSFTAEAGVVSSLIGPNGAGKTTLFNAVTGVLDPDQGRIVLDGCDLTGTRASVRARAGMARTFQRLEVFGQMTVEENLQVAAEAATPARTWRGLLRVRPDDDPEVDGRVDAVIERIGLGPVRGRIAGTLSTGTLRLVELGRALCTDPSVLLLDEPASGLDEAETRALTSLLRTVAADGVAVVLIEHDMDLVMEVSEVVHVLDHGSMLASGSPATVAADRSVRAAYLGGEVAAGADGARGR